MANATVVKECYDLLSRLLILVHHSIADTFSKSWLLFDHRNLC